ncbi:hypothetical protein [Erythrobacter ani]|uniref:RHS repeat protein n=1 Tax=Erythrobacter ani TaxID=2827235 RepID=A0ABS6SMM9_9SPHN|nr:RHS repeat protein [Erythrobacter ani]
MSTIISFLLAASASTAVQAQETATYSYDAVGRLTQVDRDKGAGDQASAEYEYDSAGNRTKVRTSTNGSGNSGGDGGSGSNGANQGFVVVPLNGYSLIFYKK